MQSPHPSRKRTILLKSNLRTIRSSYDKSLSLHLHLFEVDTFESRRGKGENGRQGDALMAGQLETRQRNEGGANDS